MLRPPIVSQGMTQSAPRPVARTTHVKSLTAEGTLDKLPPTFYIVFSVLLIHRLSPPQQLTRRMTLSGKLGNEVKLGVAGPIGTANNGFRILINAVPQFQKVIIIGAGVYIQVIPQAVSRPQAAELVTAHFFIEVGFSDERLNELQFFLLVQTR